MRKSGGAVIRMQANSANMDFLVGSMEILQGMPAIPSLSVFSDLAVNFLEDLSRELINDKNARAYSDVISFAYWIRRASLEKAKTMMTDGRCRIGRGVALHIAPSNVPVNFAVTMTYSLLSGNCTVIRVSSKPFEQIAIICRALNKLLSGAFSSLIPYVCVVRYEHSDEITAQLSAMCDVRVVWGGNRTIAQIRKASLPPRAIELTFSDRHSIAIINSDEYLKRDPEKTAKDFYTDTYYTDQNACSSPRLVVWTGSCVSEARERFWSYLDRLVKQDYNLRPIQSVDKLLSLCLLSASGQSARLVSSDNYVVRVEVDHLSPELMNYKDSGGYFFEYTAKDINEIVPVLTKSCQTITVLGIPYKDVTDVVVKNGTKGVDRIVPMGMAMGIEYIWDGFDMISSMSRIVYFPQ